VDGPDLKVERPGINADSLALAVVPTGNYAVVVLSSIFVAIDCFNGLWSPPLLWWWVLRTLNIFLPLFPCSLLLSGSATCAFETVSVPMGTIGAWSVSGRLLCWLFPCLLPNLSWPIY
jgi:hypothetical protein